jgi:RND family efflux transporter MFP subunit
MQVTVQERRTTPRTRLVVLLVSGVVVLGALAWWGIASRARAMSVLTTETREFAVPTVAVVSPKHGAPQEEIVLPGTMQAYTDAPIYARTSGYLTKRYVELGAHVKSGQLLAEIDAPELEQQLQQARADLATADANARLARITADRYKDLVKTESVSQQDADNAVGTLEARVAAVESAKHNVRRLEQLQSFTKINAPFDGVITVRNTDVGALIDPGAAGGASRELFHIATTDRLRVFVNVPEIYSRAASPGLTADLTLTEFPGRKFAARLVRTAQSLDLSSRTLLVELEVPNRGGELLAGAFTEVHLKLPTPTSTYLLPVNTFMFRSDGLRIAVVRDEGTVSMMSVALGRDYGTEAEVLGSLTGKERVVLNPPDSLADGQAVRVAPPEQKPASPATPAPHGGGR